MTIQRFLTGRLRSRLSEIGTIDFSGKWTNRLGSEMNLSASETGKLQGTFQTHVGTPSPAESFDLVGFVSGDLITFTVDFRPHGSLAAWAGHYAVVSSTERIYTLWHLAENIKDEEKPTNLWAGILAGANVFERA